MKFILNLGNLVNTDDGKTFAALLSSGTIKEENIYPTEIILRQQKFENCH